MKTLQLSSKMARELYPKAAPEFKTLLEENFTKEFFNQKITDRIKNFDDVLEYHGINPSDFENSLRGLETDEIGLRKCKLVTACLNEGWAADWNNSDQPKYFIWWQRNKNASFGLSYCSVHSDYQFTSAPSRLCFKTAALAQHAAKYFLKEYSELINF